MSDEENESEQDEEESENESGEGSGSESGDDSDAGSQSETAAKAEAVREDIALVRDIVAHIRQTSKRIAERQIVERKLQTLEQSNAQQAFNARRPVGLSSDWGNYEQLSEAERAELLERALLALAQDG